MIQGASVPAPTTASARRDAAGIPATPMAATAAVPEGRVGITDSERAAALERVNTSRPRYLRLFWEWAKSFQLAVLLFLVIRAFVVEAFKIPSGSMEGTLLVGDFLLVNKMVYGAEVPFTGKRLPAVRQPERGDVLVFQWPVDPTKNFVKRLVGVPGDTLRMEDGVLFRNGVRLQESYVRHSDPGADPAGEEFRWQRDYLVRTAEASMGYHPSRNNWGPLVVPLRHLFVLGDNR
ncbi:MAG TPA: signal peptidase I, partial [Gemmatimonadaceae bacterium]|nr:signal peptidase I [Gemmatimonadaceae bacterium]